MTARFRFRRFDGLDDGVIQLQAGRHIREDPVEGLVPAYGFHIILSATGEVIGMLYLRISSSPYIHLYAGHIGYWIDEPFRGRRYAARACRLVAPVARAHGLDALWITTNPDNLPSRRTCELIGARYVETVDVPPHSPMFAEGDRQKMRFLWELN